MTCSYLNLPLRISVEVKTEKAPKTSFFDGLKAEYKKIIWPDQKTVTKQTIAVVSVSVALGVIIAGLDIIIVEALKLVI